MKKDLTEYPQKNEIKKIDHPVFFNYIKVINYELTEVISTQKNDDFEHLKSERFYKTILKI